MDKHRQEFAEANLKNFKNKLKIAKNCLNSSIENITNCEYFISLMEEEIKPES